MGGGGGVSIKFNHSDDRSQRCQVFISAFTVMMMVLLYSSSRMELVASLGINYGRIGNNLPSPERAVSILKSMGATRVKLYDADPSVLKAFANTNIELIIGLGNEYLSKMSDDPAQALSWVKTNVQCHLPATKITCIAVGNEVLTTTTTTNDTTITTTSITAHHLLPTMQNIHSALSTLHLDDQVTITTPHSLAILQTSYPPSSAKFRPDLLDCIRNIVAFNTQTGAPFLINAYPFLAYKANPNQVSLDFVLFQQRAATTTSSSSSSFINNNNNNNVIVDPVTKLRYDNMLFAQIDAVHAALEKIGYKDDDACVQISETGWPSKGDPDEPGATPDNALRYNTNLINLIIHQKKGTPLRPNANLNIYLFALFNENLKPGPTSERNFGLYKPDGTPAYPLVGLGGGGLSTSSTNNNNNNNNTSGTSGDSSSSSQPTGSSNGYMSITSDAVGSSLVNHSALWLLVVMTSITAEVVVVAIKPF